ncbi:MAG: (4Fe-4S)-binding protein [Anaerolineae bacterium SM23_ 63]|nr:MAG: (4Fe-4S)-binding protein [Anaerolineae bacterium SM23_ 63]
MKQLVILSGKGGTGKTSVAAAFSHLATEGHDQISAVLADADVDAANLELVLAPHILEREDFWGGQVAKIGQAPCISCGDCVDVCRFDAIHESGGLYHVDPIACEGCAACVYHCPYEAITMEKQIAGQWFRSESHYGPLFHAELYPAQENSGKLVTLIKQRARLLALDEGHELVIVDGPPGIGCPVISAASGADLALIVAEPSVAGVHDMQRILRTTEHFGVRALVCINKSDLYPEGSAEITSYCYDHNFEVIGTIPYDIGVTEAMTQGEPVTVYQPSGPAGQALREVWTRTISAIRDVGE